MDRRMFLQTGVAAIGAPKETKAEPRITSSLMLWTLKGTIEQKLEIAAQAGVRSVELIHEYVALSDADLGRVKKLARSLHLGIDTVLALPDWKTRPVSMVKPEQRENFLTDVRRAIVVARKLDVPQLILASGDEVLGKTHEEQYANLLEATKRAGDLAAQANLTIIVEPLNSKVNHKGCFLTTCVEGLKLIKDADNPHVRLLFDIYHEQVQIGNVIRTLTEALPHVAVFHIADNPGRNDPGTGEMNYPNIYRAIQKTGYSGYIAMEYLPLGGPVSSLQKAVRDMDAVFGAA